MSRPVSIVLGLAFATMVVIVIGWTGCTDSGAPDGELEREINLFSQKLASGQSFESACQELDVLCKNTGFGCQAHKLFCEVPTKAYICNKLVAACANGSTAACQVYNSYCDGGGTPTLDAFIIKDGISAPDGGSPPGTCGDNICDPGEDCQNCPGDCWSWCADSGIHPQCGDNICEHSQGEDCQNCPGDCGQCYSSDSGYQSYCGDNDCDPSAGEDCQSCPQDCGWCYSPDAGV